MPIGGATTIGALGYLYAADEIQEQLAGIELVVVATGSGGTHAGLVAGFGDHARVLGVSVGARPDLDEQVTIKAREVAAMDGRAAPEGVAQLDFDRAGDGYGSVTDDGRAALEMTAHLEGLILDPVYTGKAMAGLIAARREDRIGPDTRVVFVHTGGMPALLAEPYSGWVSSPLSELG
jgi:D-cysteine desulfhydrase